MDSRSHSHQSLTGTQVLCNLCHTHKERHNCSIYTHTHAHTFRPLLVFKSHVSFLSHPDMAYVTQEIFYSAESIPIRTFCCHPTYCPSGFISCKPVQGVFLPQYNSESLTLTGSEYVFLPRDTGAG